SVLGMSSSCLPAQRCVNTLCKIGAAFFGPPPRPRTLITTDYVYNHPFHAQKGHPSWTHSAKNTSTGWNARTPAAPTPSPAGPESYVPSATPALPPETISKHGGRAAHTSRQEPAPSTSHTLAASTSGRSSAVTEVTTPQSSLKRRELTTPCTAKSPTKRSAASSWHSPMTWLGPSCSAPSPGYGSQSPQRSTGPTSTLPTTCS